MAALKNPAPVALYPTESAHQQSMHMLMAGHDLGVFRYRGPVDMRNPAQVRTAVLEIWPNLAGRGDADLDEVADVWLPQDDGMYYMIIVDTDDGERQPMLLPEGHVVWMVAAIATRVGLAAGLAVLPRHGILPRQVTDPLQGR